LRWWLGEIHKKQPWLPSCFLYYAQIPEESI
jgi:hypothetical protein